MVEKRPDPMPLTDGCDPIIAIATAPGKGGVGVVRLSLPSADQAHLILNALFNKSINPRYAHRLFLRDEQHKLIDEGLCLYFAAPSSFTGEHVIEFQGHGGPAVLRAVIEHLLTLGQAIGLRLARAGEFTERAFLNDKLDLAQAEAVADLIDAGSVTEAKAAAASLSGEFSRRVNQLADQIIHLRLLVEATLDFPEEEIEFLEKAGARGMLAQCIDDITVLIKQAKQGAQLRDGLTVVLAGRPNVGKSSLLNALAGQDVSIVTSIAGTTRDRIAQSLEIDGIALTIVDTAGLRLTSDEIEQIGIERTQESLRQADVVLHVIDLADPSLSVSVTGDVIHQQQDVTINFPPDVPVIRIFNKMDIRTADISTLLKRDEQHSTVTVSAKTGEGMDTLKKAILDKAGLAPGQEFAFLARERHVQALLMAECHLQTATEHARHDDRILDLFAEELRLAHDALGEITGRMLPDDLLGLIFSRFCIGK